MPLFFLIFALTPVLLAVTQNVPTQSTFQLVVLLVSVGAFGLMLGLFWLSRLMPRDTVKMKASSTMRWHKVIGYAAGLFFLVHPVLMIARRFWVQESLPLDNLKLMIASPLLRTGIIAWLLLVLIIAMAIVRKKIPAKIFRVLHGLLSVAFTVLATWHVIAVGRHSNSGMTLFWVLLATVAIAALLLSYLKPLIKNWKGVTREPAQ